MNLRDRGIAVLVMVPALTVGIISTPFYRALIPVTAVLPAVVSGSIEALPGPPNLSVVVTLVTLALIAAVSLPRPDFWVSGVVATSLGIMLASASGLEWVHEIVTDLIGIGRPTTLDMVGIVVPVIAWTLLLFQQQSANDMRLLQSKGLDAREMWSVRFSQAAWATGWTGLGVALALLGRGLVEGVRIAIPDVVDTFVMVGAGLLTVLGLALLGITRRQRIGPAAWSEIRAVLEEEFTHSFSLEPRDDGEVWVYLHPDDHVAMQRRKGRRRRALEEDLNVRFHLEPTLSTSPDAVEATAQASA